MESVGFVSVIVYISSAFSLALSIGFAYIEHIRKGDFYDAQTNIRLFPD